MASRSYTAEDYGACRWIVENRGADMKAPIDETPLSGHLTVAMAERLALLRLLDGPQNGMYDGLEVRLSGLGDKTGEEAIRLGIAAIPTLP